ncbi:MAG: hypothetical protein RH980_18685 [Roseovarius confluentis]|jgi:hypothetical protein
MSGSVKETLIGPASTVRAEKSCIQTAGKADRPSARREKSFGAVIWDGFRFLVGHRSREFIANRVEAQDLARDRFAAMLRHPFQGASDHEVARAWAPRLQRSERQVLNWLACTHSASIEDIYIVGAALGVWTSAQVLVGERTRDDVLAQIGQK